MAGLTLEIVTGEQLLFRETEIDEVIAPGTLGELGVLPNHAPLVTSLQPGMVRVKKGTTEEAFFVGSGFLEVQADTVTILADAAERGDEIDLERAEAARARAEERLRSAQTVDHARADAAMRRSLMRLKVGRRRRVGREAPRRPRPE